MVSYDGVSTAETLFRGYMESCLLYAREKPWILVKINKIIEFEEQKDIEREELVWIAVVSEISQCCVAGCAIC